MSTVFWSVSWRSLLLSLKQLLWHRIYYTQEKSHVIVRQLQVQRIKTNLRRKNKNIITQHYLKL